MALPTIIVNSATGSDTTASGAGPGDGTHTGSALSGTANASTDAAGTTVTLPNGTVLTNVTTDGSSVIFISDATAGARNFSKITATAGSGGATPTVTVSDAFGLNLTNQTWAIGGKRASIGSTTSVKLIENNAASGDAMPGWVIQMESGHSETIAAIINPRRSGDTTNGPITLRATSGAVTRPLLTFSNNGDAFALRANGWVFRDFEIRNSNATKTASVAFDFVTGNDFVQIINIKIADSTNKFWKCIVYAIGPTHSRIDSCELGNAASVGIHATDVPDNTVICNNWIHNCTSHGIADNGTGTAFFHPNIYSNAIVFNGGSGISLTATTATVSAIRIRENVVHGNSSDGLTIASSSAQLGALKGGLIIENNRFTFNGTGGTGYGINFSGSGITDQLLNDLDVVIRNNDFFSNATAKYNPTTLTVSQNEVTTDPSSGAASNTKDYAGTVGGSNFMSSVSKGLGYPGSSLPVGTTSGSTSYADIGLQHQDTGGSGGPVGNNFRGGFSNG